MTRLRHFVTDLGAATDVMWQDARGQPTGEQMHIGRYGVWEEGGHRRKAECVACGDDLAALCAPYGIDPASVIALAPERPQVSN